MSTAIAEIPPVRMQPASYLNEGYTVRSWLLSTDHKRGGGDLPAASDDAAGRARSGRDIQQAFFDPFPAQLVEATSRTAPSPYENEWVGPEMHSTVLSEPFRQFF